MKNKKGFTLIELLAVIVVLAIVMVLATSTVLPYMANARKDSFLLEATNAVKAAENAKDLYTLGQIKMPTNAELGCVSGSTMCFTVGEFIDLEVYDSTAGKFEGKVIITDYNTQSPTYTLYFEKGSEFTINGDTKKDYTDYAGTLTGTLTDTLKKCSCS